MTDTSIATEYLNDLLKRLSVGYASGDQHHPELDPDCVDWAFAAECWLSVRTDMDKFWTDAMELEAVKCELHGCKLERDKARNERNELLRAINLHLSHHEVGCVYLDDAVARLEDRIND